MSLKKFVVTLSILVLKIYASVYLDCVAFQTSLGFNITSSQCLVNQGHPTSVSEFSQYLSSTNCLNILSTCGNTYTSGPNCMSNSLIQVIYNSNQYFSKVGFYIKGSVYATSVVTQTGPSIYVNDVAQSYNYTSFKAYCTNYYYNIYNKVVSVNTNFLNLTFSALPLTQKASQTIYSGIVLAIQYCPNNCTNCDDNSCYSCQQGYYPGGLNCLQCDPSCLSCLSDGPSSCVICIQPNYYISVKANNNCVSLCDTTQAQYIDNTNLNQKYCRQCGSLCQTCMNSSSCASCINGYYLSNGSCLKCDSSCKTCSASGNSNCIICSQANSYISIMQNNQCVSSCDLSQGQYIDLSNPQQMYCRLCNISCQTCNSNSLCNSCLSGFYLNGNQCIQCDNSCSSCNGSGPNQCLTCKQFSYFISVKLNGICTPQCDLSQAQFIDSTTNPLQQYCMPCNNLCQTCNNPSSCSTCIQGYYFNGNQCTQCDSSCLSCTGQGASKCDICKNSYYISISQNNLCVSECNLTQPQYIDQTNPNQFYCRQCQSICQTCSSQQNCTSCIPGYYLYQNQCIQCDVSCKSCTGPGPNNCSVCSQQGYYISIQQNNLCLPQCDLSQAQYIDSSNSSQLFCRKCLASCQKCNDGQSCFTCLQGYYLANNICNKCDSSCASCKGASQSDCLICNQNYFILVKQNNICVPQCDLSQSQFIDNSNPLQLYCMTCKSSCQTCINSTNCTSCTQGYYLNGSICFQCDSSCLSCTGPSSSDCIVCAQSGDYISLNLNKNCVASCDTSQAQYIDAVTNPQQPFCRQCGILCQTCSDSQSCTACIQGYYLQGSQCFACDPSCLSCAKAGLSNCIICKQQGYFISTKLNNICVANCDLNQAQYIDQSNPLQYYCKQCSNFCQNCTDQLNCSVCIQGYYLNDNKCFQCDSSCLSCFGQGSSSCSICSQSGYYISTKLNNQCVPQCDTTQAQYVDSNTNPQQYYCRQCSESCLICNNSTSCTICKQGYYLNGNICSPCDSSCLSCFGPGSNNCLICQQSGYYISIKQNNICILQCDTSQQQYVDNTTNLQQMYCKQCDKSCLTCSNGTSCLTCNDGDYIIGSLCSQCQLGYFMTDNQCTKCDDSCQSCSGQGPSNCVVCSQLDFYISSSQNNICVSQCDLTQSQYIDNITNPQQMYCRKCPSSCQSCNNDTNCTSCIQGYFLNQNQCFQCDSSCLTCLGPGHTNCIVCAQANSYISVKQNNSCVSVCDTTQAQYIDTLSNPLQNYCRLCNSQCQTCSSQQICTQCIQGYYLNQYQCNQCNSSCQSCSGGSESDCIICQQQGYYISTQQNNTCVTQCDVHQGQYIDNTTNPKQMYCRQCSSNCLTCQDQNTCIYCIEGYFLNQNQCKLCDSSCQSCYGSNPNNCIICQLTDSFISIKQNNICVSQCDLTQGQYIDTIDNQKQKYCRVCPTSCQTCTNSTNCTSCIQGYFLNVNQCQKCDDSCLSCLGPSNSNCIICSQPNYYISTKQNNLCVQQCDLTQAQYVDATANPLQKYCKQCQNFCQTCSNQISCDSCIKGYYLDGNICKQCDSSCQSCSAAGPSMCIVCLSSGFFISTKENNKCVPLCDINQAQYIDNITNAQQKYCIQCSSLCQTCSNSSSCSSCIQGYYLNQSQCSLCDNSCLACSGPGPNNCIICKQPGYYISIKQSNMCVQECDISITQYIDSSTNPQQNICRQCNSVCQTCNNQQTCNSCIQGYYLYDNQCYQCDKSCQTCTGPEASKCIVCYQTNYYISINQNNICVPQCDLSQAQFVDITTNQQQKYCRPCNNFCQTCNNETSCLTCKQGYFLNGNQCSLCDASCQSCSGQGPTNCTVCKQSGNYISTKQNNICVAQCDLSQSQFIDITTNLQQKYCRQCSILCQTCSNQTSCNSCITGYFLNGNQCLQCDNSCQSCSSTGPNSCIVCSQTGYFISTKLQNICVQQCDISQAQFIDSTTNPLQKYCRQCNQLCQTCNNSVTCSTCIDGYYLSGSQCLQCDNTCQTCFGPSQSNCIICSQPNQYISSKQNNICTPDCDISQAQFIDSTSTSQKYCRQCNQFCQTCSNATNCSTCIQGYVLNGGTCQDCGQGKYQNGNICSACDGSCYACKGPGASDCTICSQLNFYISTKQNNLCVQQCDTTQSQYIDKTNPQQMYCSLCNQLCLTCKDGVSCITFFLFLIKLFLNIFEASLNRESMLYYEIKQGLSLQYIKSQRNKDIVVYQIYNTKLGILFSVWCISIKQNNICVSSCDLNQAQYVDKSNIQQLYCRQCQQLCQTCQDSSSCTTCALGNFMSNNLCTQCHSSCAYCSGPNQNQCTVCLQPGYFISNRQNNICLPICDQSQAQYVNLTINPLQQYCSQCSTLCQTCLDTQYCTSCISGYFLLENKCYKCDNSCQSCVGPGPNNCLVCSQPIYYISKQQNNICIAQCDSNQSFYVDSQTNPNQKICQQCSMNCLICSSSIICNQCKQGFYLNGNTCSPCMQGYYQNGNQCLPCDSSCKICSGQGPYSCIICSNSNYFISEAQNNLCVPQCMLNQAQYIDSTTNSLQNYCRQCPKNCQTCKNGIICTSCQYGFFLSSNQCTLCYQGYYLSGNQCIQCDSSCLSCKGPGPNNCIICSQPNSFISTIQNNICTSQCDLTQGQFIDNYTNQSQQYCRSCGNLCQTCNIQYICTSCVQGFFLNANLCSLCKEGFYFDGIQCFPCDDSCQLCNGPAKTNCIKCKDNLYYQQSTSLCTKNCSISEYVENQNCIKCDKSCSSCLNLQNCQKCNQGYYFFQNTCVQVCPNGYQSNQITYNCDLCEDYTNKTCQSCYATCKYCILGGIQTNQCISCFNQTRYLDQNNFCQCLNPNDIRNNFYLCSFQNIAVLNAYLSEKIPQLLIDFGSPIISIIAKPLSPQSFCQNIFDPLTIKLIGQDSSCQITGNFLIVNLTDASTVMEGNKINLQPSKLQFIDYDVPLDTFYRNIVNQNKLDTEIIQFDYNPIQNTCNPIIISLKNIQNDALRGFQLIKWQFYDITNGLTLGQQSQVNQIIFQANKNQNTTLILNPKYIPSDQNITILFNYLLKVNKTGQLEFKVLYQKQKIIMFDYVQSQYPPIYRYMSLSFYFQFFVQMCDLGNYILNQYEPLDISINSEISQLRQNFNNYTQQYLEYNIPSYTLPSNYILEFNVTLQLNLLNSINKFQKNQLNILQSSLYISIFGGSSFISSYQNQLNLTSKFRDYEIKDEFSPQNIVFSWDCQSLNSQDKICYDQNDNKYQIQSKLSSLLIPAGTFQPYSVLLFTVTGTKDIRKSNFSVVCTFTEIDILPLRVVLPILYQEQRINLNQEIIFSMEYDQLLSDSFTYTGSIYYYQNLVGTLNFDYYQVKFRIWNYFTQVDPSNNILQIRFSLYSPSTLMPSLTTINIQLNIPPQNCILTVNPIQGIALQTIFFIQISNCQDQDTPLTYQFFYYNSQQDYQIELKQPLNILRRQIVDQSINNYINTILPQGNLIIMAQVIDSQYGVSNTTVQVQVQQQNISNLQYLNDKSALILYNQQSQYISRDQFINLNIIGEDLSQQKFEGLDQLKLNLISYQLKKSLLLPKYSLLPTMTNKVALQILQSLLLQQVNNNQKQEILDYSQAIINNIYQQISENSMTQNQKNNDYMMQNLFDLYQLLDQIMKPSSFNADDNYQFYIQLSNQIGRILLNLQFPNQGAIILNGSISNILLDTITDKYLSNYVQTSQNIQNQSKVNIFSVIYNTFSHNIYENTTIFQDYTSQLSKATGNNNFTYSKNKLIFVNIINTSNDIKINNYNIMYQFNNSSSSKIYNMTCIQYKYTSWNKQNCSILIQGENLNTCLCKEQLPTTIIEDIDSVMLVNDLQSGYEQYGIKIIYAYAVFWMAQVFSIISFGLFVLGRHLDFKTQTLINIRKEKKNIQFEKSIENQQKQAKEILEIQLEQFESKNKDQLNKTENQVQEQDSFKQQEDNQLDDYNQNKKQDKTKKIKQIDKKDQIEEIEEKQIYQNLANKFNRHSFVKKIVIFHPTFGIYYIFDNKISRSARFSFFYLKIIHSMALSIQFMDSIQNLQQISIGFLNGCILEIGSFTLSIIFQQGMYGSIYLWKKTI
ncbi:hypothetical protein ABPG72_011102 [Tetrahymena utriculariae]